MATITLDGKQYHVNDGDNLLQAGLSLKKNVPYFCWHPALGSVGSCRLCAVKQFSDASDQRGRLVMACMTPVTDGAIFALTDPQAQQFRATVIESLMTNHPHDCPVCEEGGECHLQDMTQMSTHTTRRYQGKKRTHTNQYLGPFINHEMNRCIACYRCVRYYNNYVGGDDLQAMAAHNHVYFGRYEPGTLDSEFAGNLVEVCPTGVFTDKTFSQDFSRKWDLQSAPSVCTHCAVGCNTSPGERYGRVKRIVNRYNREVNGYFLCDRGRFGYAYNDHPSRILEPHSQQRPIDDGQAINKLVEMLTQQQYGKAELLAIGSPRSSIENNYALMHLVGHENFYMGVSEAQLQVLVGIRKLLLRKTVITPSLSEIEAADAVVILGEDVSNTAPRIALAIRQSVRNQGFELAEKNRVPVWQDNAVRGMIGDQRNPICIADVRGTRLDDIAHIHIAVEPDVIAKMGRAVAGVLSGEDDSCRGLSDSQQQWVNKVVAVLRQAKRPLIVTGSACQHLSIIHAAGEIYNVVESQLKEKSEEEQASIHAARLYCCLPESNSLGLALLTHPRAQSLADLLKRLNCSDHRYNLFILENNLDRHLQEQPLLSILNLVECSVLFDHSEHTMTERVDLCLPVPTTLESQGTFVNSEGRAQRFYPVKQAALPARQAWQWMKEALLEWVSIDPRAALFNRHWHRLAAFQQTDQLIADCAKEVELLADIDRITALCLSDEQAVNRKYGIGRQTLRYSGRTAMHANEQVAEKAVSQDYDSVFTYSMEGMVGTGAQLPYVWSPGWNSNQSLHKFQQEVAGDLIGDGEGVRLLDTLTETCSLGGHSVRDSASYVRSPDELLLVPAYEVFGSGEWSANAEAINKRSSPAYIAVNEITAHALSLSDWDTVTFSIDQQMGYRLHLRVDNSVAAGIALLSLGCQGAPAHIPGQCLVKLHLAELPIPKPRSYSQQSSQLIASDRGNTQ